jgi:hypothetical protein
MDVSQNARVAKVSSFAKAKRLRVYAAFPVAKDRCRIDDFRTMICNAWEARKNKKLLRILAAHTAYVRFLFRCYSDPFKERCCY